MGDLLDLKQLDERLSSELAIKNAELKAYGAEPVSKEEIMKGLMEVRDYLVPHITDTSLFLQKCIKENKKVLFEGAQGAMLCLTHGTYPYVTSSSPLATAIPVNTGLPLTAVNAVLGVMKAYTTRVGEGPFPTELHDEIGDQIREKGHEYGTVTKRPRRVGWLDLAVLKYVKNISGITHVGLMLLDVLGGLDEIKVCTGYKINGETIDYMPCDVSTYTKVEPIYKTLPGWKEDIRGIRNYEDLPENCRKYIEFIEKQIGFPITMISNGPSRDDIIYRNK
jgi:adenylosuccinate synthase